MHQRFLLILAAAAAIMLLAAMPVSATLPDLRNMSMEEQVAYMENQPHVSLEVRNAGDHLPAGHCYGECPQVYPSYTIGDTVEFLGKNTASAETYLFITGPGLDERGAQISKPDPARFPVESGNPDTFYRVSMSGDRTFVWAWDTRNYVLEEGNYDIWAVSAPYGRDDGRKTASARTMITIKKSPGTSASPTTTASTPAPVATTKSGPAETDMQDVVMIRTPGSQDYTLGDEINFTGTNTAGWKTYLFITGPGLAANGSQIQSTDPKNAAVVNDNAATFKQTDVQGDHTWSWRWGTAGSQLDAGTYTVYAMAKPRDKAHITSVSYGTTSITLKKPAGSQAAPVSATTAIPVPAAPAATPAPSPGFGVPAALAGLGAIAVIMSRRH